MEQSKFYQIKNVTEHEYTLVGCDGSVITRPIQDVDKSASVFTIQDARDGDVLADGNLPFIFKKIDSMMHSYAYCGISVDDGFKIESDGELGEWTWMQDIKPATKEQRDTLMKAMTDAGYIFDFEKKELKKIEQKSAWTEEDGEILDGIIVDVEVLKEQDRTKDGKAAYQKEIDWLKSLKDRVQPQSHWKPSGEQMAAFEAMLTVSPQSSAITSALIELHEQLKKLMEE